MRPGSVVDFLLKLYKGRLIPFFIIFQKEFMRVAWKFFLFVCIPLLISKSLTGQQDDQLKWLEDGTAYLKMENEALVSIDPSAGKKITLVSKAGFMYKGQDITPEQFTLSKDQAKLLVFTHSARVWRYKTRGDYWLLDLKTGVWKQLGKGLKSQSLMFAKFSPDGKQVAYVSEYNLYAEDLALGIIKPLTKGGNRRLVNGTFDWVYEEEFSCRDGFRWGPDSKSIAYWQVDAAGTRDYYMINNTDSVYSRIIPVEYPKAGQSPSAVRIGVVSVASGKTTWMNLPGDPRNNYIPRMEWVPGGKEIILQQLNRKQNESRLWVCPVNGGQARNILTEKDEAWVEVAAGWDGDYNYGGWDWIKRGDSFLWASEKDGWRHLYQISLDGKKEWLVTQGDYDVIDISLLDEKGGFVYFIASPGDAVRKYLYRAALDGKTPAVRITPGQQAGTHEYQIAPSAKIALHKVSSVSLPEMEEWISLPDHQAIGGISEIEAVFRKGGRQGAGPEFFTIRTEDGVEMDAWMVRPKDFNPAKKYPVLFYVYTEPAGTTVTNQYRTGFNFLYRGSLPADGYFYISIDNRGTPAPKGRAWRKSIYRKIGLINIRDQAMAAKEILKWPYIDSSRVAVWGWSGGGSATLNLLFQYPEIYKTGIAIAAVANQLTYDNIYQERYMGLPQENREDFIKGSPITYAKNLKGNLLYIHGTGDDNVHYQNAEMLVNELIRHNKQFRFMPYPNRSHGINEGEGTTLHLQTIYTNYLREHCPPGGR